MKKFATLLLVILLCVTLLALVSCGDKTKKLAENEVRITVGGSDFIAKLSDTKAAKELKKALPMTLEMRMLNAGTVLYTDLGSSEFTEQPDSSAPMSKGDIILRGNNRLEIYCGFAQPESVTRIGSIREQDVDAFVAAVQALRDSGNSTTTVKISK